MRASDDPVEALEHDLKKLRIAYEKYFAGVERIEPARERDEVKQSLKRLMTQGHNKNTARRFRLQSLQASLVTHEQYWTRVTRQIEEGTFRRDLHRAQRRQLEHARAHSPASEAEAEAPAPELAATAVPGNGAAAPALGTPLAVPGNGAAALPAAAARAVPSNGAAALPPGAARAVPGDGSTRALPPPLPRRGGAEAPPPAAAAGSHPESIRRLYEAFVRAREQTGETRPVSIDSLAATVRKQVAAIRDRHRCERVELTVTIKEGRAILRAVPK